jgi:hypothetical protein
MGDEVTAEVVRRNPVDGVPDVPRSDDASS